MSSLKKKYSSLTVEILTHGIKHDIASMKMATVREMEECYTKQTFIVLPRVNHKLPISNVCCGSIHEQIIGGNFDKGVTLIKGVTLFKEVTLFKGFALIEGVCFDRGGLL